MQLRFSFFAALVFSLATPAWGSPFPQRFLTNNSEFAARALGDVCYTMFIRSDLVPCNPAFLAERTLNQFSLQGLFGESGGGSSEADDLLSKSHQDKALQSILQRNYPLEIEVQFEAAFRTDFVALSVAPARLSYYTNVRDQALPRVTVHAMKTDSATLAFGSYFDREWSAGLNIRYVHRKFVEVDSFITDLLIDSSLLDTKTQNALYLEPGLLWSPRDEDWSPKASLVITNWGVVDKKYDSMPMTPIFQVGGSVSEYRDGRGFNIGANYSFNAAYDSVWDPFRIALGYAGEYVDVAASWSPEFWSAGALFHGEWFRGGLTYEQGPDDPSRWMFLFGLQF